MPDRFSYKGKQILHYMGTSTFSEYTVLPEISVEDCQGSTAVQSLGDGLRSPNRYVFSRQAQQSQYLGLALSEWR